VIEFRDFDGVIHQLKKKTVQLIKFYDRIGLTKSKKQLSEDIAGLFENIMQSTYRNVRAPKKDSEPDLYFGDIPIEIKVTSTETWRGGGYSKRSGYFLLLNWSIENRRPKFFIAGITMHEDDWSSGKDNYYATTFSKRDLIEFDPHIYCGDILKEEKPNTTHIKIKQE
jgi:hypothetical protein